MKELKFSVFDLFSYALPGGLAMLAFGLLKADVKTLGNLTEQLSEISLSSSIILIFIAYIVGNVIDNLGTFLHVKIGFRIWGRTGVVTSGELSNSNKRVLVREFSPQNHFFIQQWKVVKTMSHNLSFSFLLLSLIAAVKLFFLGVNDLVSFIVLIIIGLLFSYVFLRRAHIFDSWHYKDLAAIVKTLNLESDDPKIVQK